MKGLLFVCALVALGGCRHTSEYVVGYNEEGKTLVQVCKSWGDPMAASNAYGSSCVLELRDYGRISNAANTVNVISDNKR